MSKIALVRKDVWASFDNESFNTSYDILEDGEKVGEAEAKSININMSNNEETDGTISFDMTTSLEENDIRRGALANLIGDDVSVLIVEAIKTVQQEVDEAAQND